MRSRTTGFSIMEDPSGVVVLCAYSINASMRGGEGTAHQLFHAHT
ncbi:MAG: hypothetical protein CM15mP49_38240 [Actinomycetota bacterium]|nr:MAG: hypothetical protein CM15mP49_38240 [Actinomycetota bacterium]